jgi:hypothetical protein
MRGFRQLDFKWRPLRRLHRRADPRCNINRGPTDVKSIRHCG